MVEWWRVFPGIFDSDQQLFPPREQCDAVSVLASCFMWEQTQSYNHAVLNTAESDAIHHLNVRQDWLI